MNNESSLLVVSSSPHIRNTDSIPSAMRDVIIALLPALVTSLYFFRWASLKIILTCVVVAILCEVICRKVMKREASIHDNSAIVTGLLLAFCLPPAIPVWIAGIGAVVAIVLGKQLFGGLGNNIYNPALIGRAFLTAAWPVAMTTWSAPIDGVTTATPLGIIKEAGKLQALGDTGAYQELIKHLPALGDMLIGNIGGSLGETSAFALIIGGLYLLYRGHVDWRIPFTYIGTVFILTVIIGFYTGQGMWYPLFHVLAGGLMLGAFFMATDWVTSPITKKGKVIFGLGCGLLTVLIRTKGGYPEGVCYSILLMNTVTPLIDRYTKSRVFGRVKNHA